MLDIKEMTATKYSDIRILLVGRTGHGKSSTANSIIGENKFRAAKSSMSVTKTSKWSDIFIRFGRSIEVVDTPGLFDTHYTQEHIHMELINSLLYTAPGFHAIAFVLENGRFTDELVKTKDLFFSWFGPGVEKFACIILTHAENENAVDDYLSGDIPSGLKDLVQRCGGRRRIAPIDNEAEKTTKERQVERVLHMIEEIKHSTRNTHFSNVAFQLAMQYVYNKCSGQISTQTIDILRKTGLQIQLSETECRTLDKIFEIKNKGDQDKASDVETEKPRTSRSERKVDTKTFRAYFRSGRPEKLSTLAEDDEYDGNGNTTDMTSESLSTRGNQSFDNAHDNSVSSSCNADLGHAEDDLLNKFKEDVSNGKTSPKGFYNHLRGLWISGKKKFKCTIL